LLKTRSFLEQPETMCEGSGKRYVVSMGKFRNMQVSFPKSKQEQTRIATILSDMDAEIETLEKKLAKYKQVKQGLMQVLLTGKIRLV
ncbi:MAG TPA: restriction endonuclease subunit S, partial [Lutibacter sp.]|nr:restriction endonuclease subunit S [Lutibacter sp.]